MRIPGLAHTISAGQDPSQIIRDIENILFPKEPVFFRNLGIKLSSSNHPKR